MLIDARVAALIVAAICFCGCGTTANKNTPMSAKDEARYAAAIEASAGQGYQIIEDGEMLTMDTERVNSSFDQPQNRRRQITTPINHPTIRTTPIKPTIRTMPINPPAINLLAIHWPK